MSWKERVAKDPHGSLERSAARRGLSVEEMQTRREGIARALGGEGINEHLRSLLSVILICKCPDLM